MTDQKIRENPFKPGVGQKPPYLAGRDVEKRKFEELLAQKHVLQNMIITGLRGVGKSSLLEELKPLAAAHDWLWTGSLLSESASVSEDTIAVRLLADLSIITSSVLTITSGQAAGFSAQPNAERMDYAKLEAFYRLQPGLPTDKLRATLEYVGEGLKAVTHFKGIVFGYDEAQLMDDQGKRRQYPLSVLLDVFQSLQAKGYPYLLVFAGLPNLFPKIRSTRGYAERMFTACELENLSEDEAIEAIKNPIKEFGEGIGFTNESMKLIAIVSGGYPYFIQYICKETFDSFIVQSAAGVENPSVPIAEIQAKLHTDFFAPKWAITTERERQLLRVIASLPNSDTEFTIKDIVDAADAILSKPIGDTQINGMLGSLALLGLIFKAPRRGKYALGVPMLADYINKQDISGLVSN